MAARSSSQSSASPKRKSARTQRAGGGGQARQRKPAANPRRPLITGWLIGLAMGLFVAGIVHLEHTRPATTSGGTEATAGSGGAAGSTAGDGPRFEFYRLLSEQEVDVRRDDPSGVDGRDALPSVADQDGSEDAPPAPSAQATANEDGAGQPDAEAGERYLLQAGSFRQATDAEELKANLALLGIQARVQVVELPGGETWHRVRIGPFADLPSVNTVRERMAARQIDSILLRAGG